jgi:ankyrin repeat protein
MEPPKEDPEAPDVAPGIHDSAMRGDVDDLAAALTAAARGEQIRGALSALNEHGWSALHCAAAGGDPEPTRMLLTAGANVHEATAATGETALHVAATWGHVATCQALLTAGASADAHDDTGVTPLHKAAAYGHGEIIELLLAAGADVAAGDAHGRTALHAAAEHGSCAAVLDLLGAGAVPKPLETLRKYQIVPSGMSQNFFLNI